MFELAIRDCLVGNGIVANWLRRFERALTTLAQCLKTVEILLSQVLRLTLIYKCYTVYFRVDIPRVEFLD